MQKDRGYLDDKVTQYFHNGVLAFAGQKCQCASRNNGKSQIFDIVNTVTTNYFSMWNQVLCNFDPSKAQGFVRDDGSELVMYTHS
jgi:hypothetical protein